MDTAAVFTDKGKRRWLYPALRKGKLYQWRAAISYVYLIFFFAGPFLRIGGQPLLLLNFMERKFVLLGQVFWPQDIFLFALATLVFMVFVLLFTIAFGRVFCGWICPQTIFMEMVFRRIEIWIEGDANKRRKLDASEWTSEKLLKKGSKHGIFILLSFLIANTFLGYVIGSENLLKIITEPVSSHTVGFISIWVFTAVFYLVYSQVRELVCTVICPYGRLQGVLIDKDTMVVAYNDKRGEPRGKLKKAADQSKLGDCVDCGLCVAVCPTGIDIRNGTQLECTNCTACIDACNDVMAKINRELNLVGFYSENMIEKDQRPTFTWRMRGYSAVMALLLGVLAYFIFSRSELDMTVMRSAGMLYQEQPGNYISNVYNAEIINKSNETKTVAIAPEDKSIKIKYIQAPGPIEKGGSAKVVFFVMVPAGDIHSPKTTVKLQLINGQKVAAIESTSFIGPANN
ncbi:cytochrome c oxidase accessory protein CcoG [Mucilaginibacter pedocola]|uniref:Cytochrome c oxidase accessory protein CcoG n=1 Tax=Mucilaginibacter pedocola TaxID=1792845 RepID=A0A1S9PCQ8_9SPHI|nr:cytochrome c oxidase accessory protein CcoG [Mucilaginibacter pedocola]OOQ58740.1 cytochrome c oxidase accessory protein CcoG [Mucilaginibacter pedocola]